MPRLMPALTALAALALLAACGGGPRGDWRAEVGRPSPNLRLIQPGPPLALPPSWELPPPL